MTYYEMCRCILNIGSQGHRNSLFFFFFKQKTAYEMRISDWSSDVCSSDSAGSDNDGCFPHWSGHHVEKAGNDHIALAEQCVPEFRRVPDQRRIVRIIDRKSVV